MQEEGAVGWDPVTINRPLIWESKLFVLYILAVLVFLVVRSIVLLHHVRTLRLAGDRFLCVWETCMARVASMRRLALLTLLLSALAAVIQAVHLLSRIQETHTAGLGAVAGGVAEVLVQLELGLFVGAALYAVSSFYEGVLTHRRVSWSYSSNKARRAD